MFTTSAHPAHAFRFGSPAFAPRRANGDQSDRRTSKADSGIGVTEVFDQLVALLAKHNVTFQRLDHAPVYTSEEAARVRGTPLCSGAKALICKSEAGLAMFVMPADRRLASKQVRRANGWRKFRFGTAEEVLDLTRLKPGSIPPFGSLFGLQTYCDKKLAENESVNFNAGHHEISISMKYEDYVKVEQPIVGDYSE